jgi:hypothetical protein
VTTSTANERAVLQRALRDHGEDMDSGRRAAVESAVDRMEQILRRVAFMNEGAEAMRGAEGEAAHGYFAVFGNLLRSSDAFKPKEPPAAARSGERALVVSLYAAHARLQQRRGKRRPRSGGGLPTSRPAGAAEPCARSDGGDAAGAGRSARAVVSTRVIDVPSESQPASEPNRAKWMAIDVPRGVRPGHQWMRGHSRALREDGG